MPKKPVIGVCAVCGRRSVLTVDHIIARGFFSKSGGHRDGLPRVNVCLDCNNKKSKIENSLVIIMQFGGNSEAANAMFDLGRIDKMLTENLKFSRSLGRNIKIRHELDEDSILNPIAQIKLDDDIVEDLSQWLKMMFLEFYFLWKSENICDTVAMTCINPPSGDVHAYLDGLIESTSDRYTDGNTHQGWNVKIAKSQDGVMLFQFHFNGITQYVAASCDPNSVVIRQYSKVGY